MCKFTFTICPACLSSKTIGQNQNIHISQTSPLNMLVFYCRVLIRLKSRQCQSIPGPYQGAIEKKKKFVTGFVV